MQTPFDRDPGLALIGAKIPDLGIETYITQAGGSHRGIDILRAFFASVLVGFVVGFLLANVDGAVKGQEIVW